MSVPSWRTLTRVARQSVKWLVKQARMAVGTRRIRCFGGKNWEMSRIGGSRSCGRGCIVRLSLCSECGRRAAIVASVGVFVGFVAAVWILACRGQVYCECEQIMSFQFPFAITDIAGMRIMTIRWTKAIDCCLLSISKKLRQST